MQNVGLHPMGTRFGTGGGEQMKKGETMNQEQRDKISATMKGRQSPLRGRTMPMKHRRAISKSRRRQEALKSLGL
jgi:Spy/CpxP family protein refolding chaperone